MILACLYAQTDLVHGRCGGVVVPYEQSLMTAFEPWSVHCQPVCHYHRQRSLYDSIATTQISTENTTSNTTLVLCHLLQQPFAGKHSNHFRADFHAQLSCIHSQCQKRFLHMMLMWSQLQSMVLLHLLCWLQIFADNEPGFYTRIQYIGPGSNSFATRAASNMALVLGPTQLCMQFSFLVISPEGHG